MIRHLLFIANGCFQLYYVLYSTVFTILLLFAVFYSNGAVLFPSVILLFWLFLALPALFRSFSSSINFCFDFFHLFFSYALCSALFHPTPSVLFWCFPLCSALFLSYALCSALFHTTPSPLFRCFPFCSAIFLSDTLCSAVFHSTPIALFRWFAKCSTLFSLMRSVLLYSFNSAPSALFHCFPLFPAVFHS